MKENTVFDRILCAIFLDFSDQNFDFISLFFIFPHFKSPYRYGTGFSNTYCFFSLKNVFSSVRVYIQIRILMDS